MTKETMSQAVSSFKGTRTRSLPPLCATDDLRRELFFFECAEDQGNERHITEKYVHGPNTYELERAAT